MEIGEKNKFIIKKIFLFVFLTILVKIDLFKIS